LQRTRRFIDFARALASAIFGPRFYQLAEWKCAEDFSMPIRPWRATSIQTRSNIAVKASDRTGAWTIIKANIARVVGLIEAAAQSETPSSLVVLPEFALQGPPHGMAAAAWIDFACCAIPGPITQPLQELARRRQIYIAGHQFESDPEWPGRYFNSCFLIDPTGTVILRYRRVNTAAFPSPHDFMDAYCTRYSAAETFPVVETPLGRLAMIPCGEINVPEVARVLMMQGAEVILHPTNSPRRPAQEAAKVVRAAENMVYVISANVAGGIGFSYDGSVLGGRSHIIDFLGSTLAYEDGAGETTAVTALIDVEALRIARRQDTGTSNPLLRARWEMYRPFFNAASFYPPNSFLNGPMADQNAAQPIIAQSLRNMAKAGVIVDTAREADTA
jgi:predicted amidohydrolase